MLKWRWRWDVCTWKGQGKGGGGEEDSEQVEKMHFGMLLERLVLRVCDVERMEFKSIEYGLSGACLLWEAARSAGLRVVRLRLWLPEQ